MSDYTLNPDVIPIITDWLTPERGDETAALKHQTRLLIDDLRRRLSAAQAELASVKRCADDAVADANICRKLAERQTRLLEEAQAELVTAQAACAAWKNATIGIRDKACKGAFLFGTAQDDKAIEAHLDTIDACIPMNLSNPGQPFTDRLEKLQRLEKAVGDDEFAMKVAGQASNRPNGYPEIDAIALYRAALLEAAKAAQEQPQ